MYSPVVKQPHVYMYIYMYIYMYVCMYIRPYRRHTYIYHNLIHMYVCPLAATLACRPALLSVNSSVTEEEKRKTSGAFDRLLGHIRADRFVCQSFRPSHE